MFFTGHTQKDMKIQINDTNYSYYKQILEIIQTHLAKLYPPEILQNANPLQILNNWEQKSKTIARRAVKIGLQDLISQIKDFPPDLKEAIDKDLAKNNLPALAQLQDVNGKVIARVIKRGAIKTLEEFYIVKEEVIDLSSG